MKREKLSILLLMLQFLLLWSCTSSTSYKYKIGVSECVGGRWRDKANNEMLSAQHLYDKDVKVTILNADNSNERQCQQIDSFVDMGIDLLVVSPNDFRLSGRQHQIRTCQLEQYAQRRMGNMVVRMGFPQTVTGSCQRLQDEERTA